MQLSYLMLLRELARWTKLGKTPAIWWRDDDAREATSQLDRLLRVRDGLPISLAVVPDGDLEGLASILRAAPEVSISQHGMDHVNRLSDGSRRSEYLDDATQAQVSDCVRGSRKRLEEAGFQPAFYTPCWNVFDERLLRAVKAANYTTYSAGIFGRPTPELGHIGAGLDVLRWKRAPRFRGRARIFKELRRQLRMRRRSQDFQEPVGLLTHHLVHDEPTWRFLEWFVCFSRSRFVWRSFPQLAAAKGLASSLG